MTNWIEKHSDTLITIATIIVGFAALVTILDQRLDAQDKLISERVSRNEGRIDVILEQIQAADAPSP